MIKFSMGNQIFVFQDKYYQYGQDNNHEDRPLIIGGYESACLTHLVASYILDNTKNFS